MKREKQCLDKIVFVRFPEKDYKKLKRLAKKSRLAMSSYIRMIVSFHLKDRR